MALPSLISLTIGMERSDQGPNPAQEPILSFPVLRGKAAIDAYQRALVRISRDSEHVHRPSAPQWVFFDGVPDDDAFLLEAIEGDRMAGFVAARAARNREFGSQRRGVLEIGLLWTEPAFRLRGVSLRLLHHLGGYVEREMNGRLDMLAVYMHSCVQNPAILRVYRSAGFRAITNDVESSHPTSRIRTTDYTDLEVLIARVATIRASGAGCNDTAQYPLIVLVRPLGTSTKLVSPPTKKKRRLVAMPVRT